ncbi:hypothetical protein DBV15_00018 [Temnothorax longispinosus]|uniref:Uncharacterized protein n=1 Tax=Temnothorax longispinosus TaxID=300112 RepID=A0A4S2KHW6_9HYME|nr:hypothetical protein DBV15_00018 [Temnothorax longispinosus]
MRARKKEEEDNENGGWKKDTASTDNVTILSSTEDDDYRHKEICGRTILQWYITWKENVYVRPIFSPGVCAACKVETSQFGANGPPELGFTAALPAS